MKSNFLKRNEIKNQILFNLLSNNYQHQKCVKYYLSF